MFELKLQDDKNREIVEIVLTSEGYHFEVKGESVYIGEKISDDEW